MPSPLEKWSWRQLIVGAVFAAVFLVLWKTGVVEMPRSGK